MRLVKAVRRILRSYLSSRPTDTDRWWRMAWEWAHQEEQQNRMFSLSNRRRWPRPQEIASRYVLLCLVEMRSCSLLDVGTKAFSTKPLCVEQAFAESLRIAQVSADFGIKRIEEEVG